MDGASYLIVISPCFFIDQVQEQVCQGTFPPRARHTPNALDDLLDRSLLSIRDRHQRSSACLPLFDPRVPEINRDKYRPSPSDSPISGSRSIIKLSRTISHFRGPWPACQTSRYEQLKLDEIESEFPHCPFIRRLMPERALSLCLIRVSPLRLMHTLSHGLEQPGINPVGCNPAPQDAWRP